MSDHIAACQTCRSRVEGGLDGTAAFFRLRDSVFTEPGAEPAVPTPAAHPDIEQMARYVDGGLAGEALQEVKDHASACEACALAIADLHDFRSQVAGVLGREYRPAAEPPAVRSRPDRPAHFLPSFFLKSPAWGLATLAVLLLAGSAGLVWRAMSRKQINNQIAATAPAPIVGGNTEPVVAQLKDGGGRLVLDREGRLSGADDLPPAYRQFIGSALAGELPERSPRLAGLNRPASSLMGGGQREAFFSLSDPIGTVVLSERPVFRWSALQNATGYYVEVYDDKFNLVASSPRLSLTFWTTPRAFRRGAVYSWQVRALRNGHEVRSPRPPEPQAKFRVATQADADELAAARRNHPSSHLLLGLLCMRAGLLNDAEHEFQSLQIDNPGSATVAGLLASLRAMQH